MLFDVKGKKRLEVLSESQYLPEFCAKQTMELVDEKLRAFSVKIWIGFLLHVGDLLYS